MDKYYFLINSMEGGGAERVVSNLLFDYVNEGKDIYLITLKNKVFYNIPEKVHYIPLSDIQNNLLMFLLIPYYSFKLNILLKKYGLKDGISFLEISNFVHILSKKKAWISFRIHIDFFKGITGTIQKWLIKWLYPKAGKIIVNSRENKYDLARFLNIPENKIDVRYNPIDKEKIKKLCDEKLDKDIVDKIKNKQVFITTGRLVRQKHHEKIIETLKEYNKKNGNWVYLIIGDGPERNNLEKLVSLYGLNDNIIFMGQQKNVFKYLKYANLFLYASEVEGFPNTLLEAREMGLKIISSDFKSGAREVILGEDTDSIGKKLEYPVKGKYGMLIDFKMYSKQLFDFLFFKNV